MDVKYIKETEGLQNIMNSGATLFIVSYKWLGNDVKGIEVDKEDIEERNCLRIFRFGENVYTSSKEVMLPIVIKTKDDNYVKKMIVANIIYKEEDLFYMD